MSKSKNLALATQIYDHLNSKGAGLGNVSLIFISSILDKNNVHTGKQIRTKLLKMNPQIKEGSKHTNPFLYRDTKEWYNELEPKKK